MGWNDKTSLKPCPKSLKLLIKNDQDHSSFGKLFQIEDIMTIVLQHQKYNAITFQNLIKPAHTNQHGMIHLSTTKEKLKGCLIYECRDWYTYYQYEQHNKKWFIKFFPGCRYIIYQYNQIWKAILAIWSLFF